MKPRSALRVFLRCVGQGSLLILAALASHHLTFAPYYEYPEAKAFAGSRWYNPYQDFEGDRLKANFHAHSECWGGFTNGTCPPDILAKMYAEAGYDIATISNYQSITPQQEGQDLYLTAYEHALGSGQQHQTVVGSEEVSWFDYLLPQWLGHKQHVLEILSGQAKFVILNHPNKGQGYSTKDMQYLTHYHAIEVATKYSSNSTAHWDAALSAGRPRLRRRQ